MCKNTYNKEVTFDTGQQLMNNPLLEVTPVSFNYYISGWLKIATFC